MWFQKHILVPQSLQERVRSIGKRVFQEKNRLLISFLRDHHSLNAQHILARASIGIYINTLQIEPIAIFGIERNKHLPFATGRHLLFGIGSVRAATFHIDTLYAQGFIARIHNIEHTSYIIDS